VAADPNAEGNCGCRTIGAKDKTGLGALALLASLSGIAVARRRRR
jgi:MYXO-CTERM domain-containing protein